ncbi:methyltransferase, FxLD system [Nonomuraea jabiensis]|uniref:methyltransferase, FxLD system n=1 Tax=Nonomuraea jabiensis TaxID=882448 RepID=UPI00342A166F
MPSDRPSSVESPDRLRDAMVAELRERGAIRSSEIAAAFGTVPREKFAPEVPVSAVYSTRDTVVTRRNAAGKATSSISAPWLQAEMLETACLRPGMRVLEIGSGGYNAALIAELVGPDGLVISVDIDPFVTGRAILAETGYPQVKVVLGDAEHAADELGPFDVILVTIGAWDCPWGHLLAPGGRMIVPLRFCGLTRSFTFVRDGGHFAGLDPTVCGFIPIQGAGAHQEHVAAVAGGTVNLLIDAGPALDAAALDRALDGDRTERWTGVTVGYDDPFDTLHLWIAARTETFGVIWADPQRGSDRMEPAMRWFTPALITPDSFAYLTMGPEQQDAESGERRYELGVHGHCRHGDALARQLADEVATWDEKWREHPGPDFTLYPIEPTAPVPTIGRVFPKRHTQLVMAWT